MVYPRILEASQKALALDPNLAEGHRALGFALFYWNWDRQGTREEFERAIQLAPNDATSTNAHNNCTYLRLFFIVPSGTKLQIGGTLTKTTYESQR